jgi:MFS family permease
VASPSTAPPRSPAPTSMLSLLRNVEFRVLTITLFFSIVGDQLARVALSVFVFDRTNSSLQAAVAYALTFVPSAIGGPLLNGLADRLPRRSVMIASDLARAPLIAIIAIPSIPLPVAFVVLAVAGLFEAPFSAARGALLPDILHGDRYTAGLASSQITNQVSQVGGFGVAGILLLAWSPSVLLLLDAASFVLSALLIARLVSYRPAAHVPRKTEQHTAWWKHAVPDARTSLDIVMRVPKTRRLALLAWSTCLFSIGYEALGAPLARETGSGHWTVGVLLAMQPLGNVIGAMIAVRIPQTSRDRATNLLGLLCVAALIGGLTEPPLWLLLVIGVLSGIGMAFSILLSAAFVQRVAPEVRGRALGLVSSGLFVGQGLGVLLAGSIASAVDARVAVGLLGVAGTAAVLVTLWVSSQAAGDAQSPTEPDAVTSS